MKMPFQSKPQKASPIQTHDAFNTFYSQNHLIVFRYIFGLHGGPIEDIEDLTAETFIRAWKSRRRFQGDADAALGWVLKIARNLVIDTHRRQKNRGISLDIDQFILPAPGIGPEERLAHQEQMRTIWSRLAQHPTEHREIIVLRYIIGWRVNQIAEHLDMNENTVSVNIRRILDRIRRDWTES